MVEKPVVYCAYFPARHPGWITRAGGNRIRGEGRIGLTAEILRQSIGPPSACSNGLCDGRGNETTEPLCASVDGQDEEALSKIAGWMKSRSSRLSVYLPRPTLMASPVVAGLVTNLVLAKVLDEQPRRSASLRQSSR